MELETLDACPLCGSGRLRDWRPAPDRTYGAPDLGFRYAWCLACGARFLRSRPTAETAGELYGDQYAPYDVARPDRAAPVELTDTRAYRVPTPWIDRLRHFYRPPRKGARFLDLGCGSAYFLLAAGAAGWEPIGADFSPAVIERVRAAGIEAHLVDEVWPVLERNGVDLVRMNHVLEHLYDPTETLDRVRAALNPDGRLHIAVPNATGLSSGVFRRYWMGLEPRHVVHYTPRVLRTVLERAGFDVVEVLHQGAPQDIGRSWEHAARAAKAPARLVGLSSKTPVRQALVLLGAGAARIGRGDRLHALARR